MADFLTPQKRSALMSRVRRKDTKPELIVRKSLHAMGFRYRLHAKELPGTPDIVMRPRKLAIFVHGCFWHCHPGCSRCRIPSTNSQFWADKLKKNQERDIAVLEKLLEMNWRILVIWECEAKLGTNLDSILLEFVQGNS